jgi:hypothetical protein
MEYCKRRTWVQNEEQLQKREAPGGGPIGATGRDSCDCPGSYLTTGGPELAALARVDGRTVVALSITPGGLRGQPEGFGRAGSDGGTAAAHVGG